MAHSCHAIGCDVGTKPEWLLCVEHWLMLPPALRLAILETYRPGQCDDWQPSAAYCRNAKEAITIVAEKEGRTVTGEEDELKLYDLFNPETNRDGGARRE